MSTVPEPEMFAPKTVKRRYKKSMMWTASRGPKLVSNWNYRKATLYLRVEIYKHFLRAIYINEGTYKTF